MNLSRMVDWCCCRRESSSGYVKARWRFRERAFMIGQSGGVSLG
jgi:hypothetical protein